MNNKIYVCACPIPDMQTESEWVYTVFFKHLMTADVNISHRFFYITINVIFRLSSRCTLKSLNIH